ncbi:MAG: M81 family metallopeptidase [Hyphomicrobiaceae bacterium]
MRLFAASLATETNTFSPIPTSRASFEADFYAPPGTHPAEPKLCTAPLVVARRRACTDGFELVEGSCFWAEPSGTVDRKSYTSMRDEILDQLRAALPVDGVLMGFHGALFVDGVDDAEGDMLEAIREVVGPDCVIGCAYDPHCHLTEKRVRLAAISILFKEYPHVDIMGRAEELVTLVLAAIRGEIAPVASLYDPRLWDFYPTTTEPMRSFVDRLKAREGQDGVLSISLAHGFMHADHPDMGSRVLVITDGRKADGDRIAKEIGDELWARRGTWAEPVLSLEAGVARVLGHASGPPHGRGLAILAEPADNAGGGAASDNTLVIHELRRCRAVNVAVAPVWDPIAVSFCHRAGLGARIALRFGGKASAGSGPPVDADVEVIGLARNATQMFGAARVPLGDTAAVRLDGGIDIVLISQRTQAFGTELFTALGRLPQSYDALVLKSAQHFAAAYGAFASLIVRAETGGCCPTHPRLHTYSKLQRPLWPLDPVVEGRLLI